MATNARMVLAGSLLWSADYSDYRGLHPSTVILLGIQSETQHKSPEGATYASMVRNEVERHDSNVE